MWQIREQVAEINMGLKFQFGPLLAVWPWESYFISQSLLPLLQEQQACCKLDSVRQTARWAHGKCSGKAARDAVTLFHILLPIGQTCLISSWLFIILLKSCIFYKGPPLGSQFISSFFQRDLELSWQSTPFPTPGSHSNPQGTSEAVHTSNIQMH